MGNPGFTKASFIRNALGMKKKMVSAILDENFNTYILGMGRLLLVRSSLAPLLLVIDKAGWILWFQFYVGNRRVAAYFNKKRAWLKWME
jgi:hypothetical protein